MLNIKGQKNSFMSNIVQCTLNEYRNITLNLIIYKTKLFK